MNDFTKVALATLFVTTFTLFLGWIPIGVLMPQVFFIIYTMAMQPKVFGSKTLVLYYLFFAYQLAMGLFGEKGFDVIIWGAKFLGMAIPLIISTIFFSPKYIKDCQGVSRFAIILSFITVLLSIRVLVNDGDALRVCAMANSTGDRNILYGLWRQGMASYDMAAMMLFMPVVLVYKLKCGISGDKKWLLWLGIALIMIFMYLGQVTTTLLLCLMVTIQSFLNYRNRIIKYISVGLVVIVLLTQISEILNFAVSATGDSALNERLISLSSVAAGESLNDNSDAGIRQELLNITLHSFISNPFLGSIAAKTGGHNYFLDLLAKYGIIGCLPFFLLIRTQYSVISSYLSDDSKRYYLIILVGFIILGIFKNLSGTEYWNYLFIYYPAILVWIDSKNKKQAL